MEEPLSTTELNHYFGLGLPMSAHGRHRFGIPSDLPDRLDTVGAVRVFRDLSIRMNRGLNADAPDAGTVRPGELMGVALLLSAMRCLVYQYGESINTGVLRDAQQWTLEQRGPHVSEKPFQRFLDLYPADPVYAGEISPEDYIVGEGPFWSNRDGALCELLLLDLAVSNRALDTYRPLFDDSELRNTSAYGAQIAAFHDFLKTQPPFPGTDQDLVTFLYAPLLASPDSLEG
ncbi:MAG: hypothetical protein L3K26_09070, partial [Candidatus Hydrogenedentes bacterium]|nr:hypothetical protein [Candidatus Hydrogenedentota bacterium]